MQNFVETQNIARFKVLLETESDPDKRRVIKQLLAEEEAKHAARMASERRG